MAELDEDDLTQPQPGQPQLSPPGPFRQGPVPSPPMVAPLLGLIQQLMPQGGPYSGWRDLVQRPMDRLQWRDAMQRPTDRPGQPMLLDTGGPMQVLGPGGWGTEPSPEWREPYMPVRPRPGTEAGRDWWPISGAMSYPGGDAGPLLPSPREALGIMGRSGRWLQRWGSPMVGNYMGRASQLAMQLAPYLDQLSNGKFSANFMKARMGQYKIMQDEMLMNAQMGLRQHQQELQAYSDVFRAWDAKAISDENAHAQLEALAQGHPNLLAILKNKGVGAMERAVQAEDQQFRDMYGSYVAHKKARDDSREDVGPDDDKDGGDRQDPMALHPDIKSPDVQFPGSVAQRDEGAPQEGRSAADTSHDDAMAELGKKYQLGKAGTDKALDYVNGNIGDADIKRTNKPKEVLQAAADIDDQTRRILGDDSKNQDDKLAALRRINPERAQTLKDLINYDMLPTDIPARSTRKGGKAQLLAEASMISNNKYKPSNAAVLQKLKKDNLAPLLAAGTLGTSMVQVYKALKEFKEGETFPQAWIYRAYANKWNRQDRYVRLYQALNQYAVNAARVQGGSSYIRVSLVNNILREMNDLASPQQIRSQLNADTADSYARLEGVNRQFKSLSGTDENIPGWDQHSDNIINAFQRHVDTRTGRVDIDSPKVPNEVKALNKPLDPNDLPPGVTMESARKELSDETREKLKRAIEAYDKNPDPAQRDNIQRMREILSEYGEY